MPSDIDINLCIESWLHALPVDSTNRTIDYSHSDSDSNHRVNHRIDCPKRLAKRKRTHQEPKSKPRTAALASTHHHHQPPSPAVTTLTPPPSSSGRFPSLGPHTAIMDDIETPRRKRRARDPDTTPRAPAVMPGDSVSQASSSSAALSSASGRSIKSSNRQLMALELSPSLHLEFGVFEHLDRTDVDSLPAGVQRMLDMRARLYGFSAGQHIVPRTHEKHVNKRTPDALLVGDAMFFDEDAETERLGPIHNVELLRDIVESTDECDAERASEAIWNGEVHHKLLRAALRPKPDATKGGPVNFAIATSATVDRSIHRAGPTKMIDFAMYVDPNTDDCRQLAGVEMEDKMKALRRRSGTDTANSTRYFYLRNKPVSVSIETKRSEGFETATLQMGTWHAAQWNFLERVAGSSPNPGPEFLPGLIVVGDEWYFVASTRQGDKTTLWTKTLIGSTRSLLGTYRVVRAVQYLAWWSLQVYWPWFVREILAIEDGASATPG